MPWCCAAVCLTVGDFLTAVFLLLPLLSEALMVKAVLMLVVCD